MQENTRVLWNENGRRSHCPKGVYFLTFWPLSRKLKEKMRATTGYGVRRLVAILPKQIEMAVWFYFFKGGFCRHRFSVCITNWGKEYHEFGQENARIWEHEFWLVLA
jgi:hypothetical protein